jgi:hypothetical protein
MTTEKQIKANRQNGLKGGVKSQTGKTVSRYNSIKHGVLSTFMTKEESDLAEEIFTELQKEYPTNTVMEAIALERIAIWYVRLSRVAGAEQRYLLSLHAQQRTPQSGETLTFQIPVLLHKQIEEMSSTYQRYETSMERNMFRALHELQRLKAINEGFRAVIPTAIDTDAREEE